MPKKIAAKEACVTIQCDDGNSFKWCVLAVKYPVQSGHKHPERVSNYYTHQAEFDGYKYPMQPQNIVHFERKENIAVNVYFISDSGAIEPLHVSELHPKDASMHVDLLLVEKHYVLIRSLSRLVRRCLTMCQTEKVLATHMERCVKHKAQAVKMPDSTK